MEVFKKNLPPEKDISKLIEELTKLSVSSGFDVPTINYQPLKKSGSYKQLTFTLTVEGEYERIRRYIYSIENLRSLICIDAITLRKTGNEKDTLAIDLTVSTFFN
jgi:Tfp pilus assembly protein PilO